MTVTYNVYRRNTPSETPVAIATELTSLNYSDTTVTIGSTYLYSVGAVKNGVEKIGTEISVLANTNEIALTSLSFSKISSTTYFDLLPAALVKSNETFASDTGQFTKYTEGTAGTTSIASNAMTITHSGTQSDIVVLNTTNFTIPQIFVQCTVNVTTLGATSYDNGGVGIAKDSNNFLFASLDRLNSIVRVQIKIGGTNTFLSSTTKTWGYSFKLGLSLVGNSVCVYADTGSGWTYLVGAALTQYDFKTVGNLTGWHPAFTLANGGGTSVWKFSALSTGNFGGVGIRDQTLVTDKYAKPYTVNSPYYYFTATLVDPCGAGYAGLMRINMDDLTYSQVGVIMNNRSSKYQNDLAPHVLIDGSTVRVTIGTWGDGFGGDIRVMYATTTTAILNGEHVLSSPSFLSLPLSTSGVGSYDSMLGWDIVNSRWILAYVITNNTSFTGNPFYVAAAYSTDLSTWTLIGVDSVNGDEGAKIINVNNDLFIACGGVAGNGNTSRVFDKSMGYLGVLNAVFEGGTLTQPHPCMIPYGGYQYIVTFDNTKYGSNDFTWGKLLIYRANRY